MDPDWMWSPMSDSKIQGHPQSHVFHSLFLTARSFPTEQAIAAIFTRGDFFYLRRIFNEADVLSVCVCVVFFSNQ